MLKTKPGLVKEKKNSKDPFSFFRLDSVGFFLFFFLLILLDLNIANSPDDWVEFCKIQRLKASPNKCPGYDIKLSDGEAPVLYIWGMQNTPSSPLSMSNRHIIFWFLYSFLFVVYVSFLPFFHDFKYWFLSLALILAQSTGAVEYFEFLLRSKTPSNEYPGFDIK